MGAAWNTGNLNRFSTSYVRPQAWRGVEATVQQSNAPSTATGGVIHVSPAVDPNQMRVTGQAHKVVHTHLHDLIRDVLAFSRKPRPPIDARLRSAHPRLGIYPYHHAVVGELAKFVEEPLTLRVTHRGVRRERHARFRAARTVCEASEGMPGSTGCSRTEDPSRCIGRGRP